MGNSQETKSLHTTKTLTLAKVGLAKVGLAKVGLAKVGRIRMAKVGLAKVGFDRPCSVFISVHADTASGSRLHIQSRNDIKYFG